MKGVEVSKTLRPDMDADALGGTVNLTLKTAQPGLHYDVWGNGGYTKIRDSYNNYKFAGSASDRFLDDKVGVLVQGNIEEKQLPSDQLNATYNSFSTTDGQQHEEASLRGKFDTGLRIGFRRRETLQRVRPEDRQLHHER